MSAPPLFDSHVHLDDPSVDLPATLAAARAAGVIGLMSAGYGPEREPLARQLPAHASWLRRSVGLHPWWLAEAADDAVRDAGLAGLAAAARAAGVVAIGEVGLDATRRDVFDAASQRRYFDAALRVAVAVELPVVLHVVRWHGHALEVLADHDLVGGVVHRFGGPPDVVAGYQRRGLHLSMATDWLRRPEKAAAVARAIAPERLLVETDWPLDDRPYGAAAVELRTLVAAIAGWRGVDIETLARQLLDNTRRAYRLAG